MIYYLASLLFSAFVLVMTVIIEFNGTFKMYGDTENYFCLGVSIIFLIIGVITDNIKRRESM